MADSEFVTTSERVRSPGIIYGTAWKKMRTEELVRTAIGQGFRGIDTAGQPRHYDEAGVGAAVAACLNQALSRQRAVSADQIYAAGGSRSGARPL